MFRRDFLKFASTIPFLSFLSKEKENKLAELKLPELIIKDGKIDNLFEILKNNDWIDSPCEDNMSCMSHRFGFADFNSKPVVVWEDANCLECLGHRISVVPSSSKYEHIIHDYTIDTNYCRNPHEKKTFICHKRISLFPVNSIFPVIGLTTTERVEVEDCSKFRILNLNKSEE